MKTVWILGAGFSKSLGAPLLADLFSPESLSRVLLAYPGLAEHLKHANEIVKLYLGGAWGLGHHKPPERQWEHAEEFIEYLDRACRDPDGLEHANLKNMCERLHDHTHNRRAAPRLLSDHEQRLDIQTIHERALRLLLAECAVFVHKADVKKSERWEPYRAWAISLGNEDTVLTFNYDCVPELLSGVAAEGKGHFAIPDPGDVAAVVNVGQQAPLFLKLHGSIDWIREGDKKVVCARNKPGHAEPEVAALYVGKKQMAVATPGPTKREMVAEGGLFSIMWKAAALALKKADQIVILGYRIPPSDSYTRWWLADGILNNDRLKNAKGPRPAPNITSGVPKPILPAENPLVVHTILGDDLNHKDSRRLKGILEGIDPEGRIEARQWPMFAEDFLGVIAPKL